MGETMMLPHLNGLVLTKEATFYKLVEELVECNEAMVDVKNHDKLREQFNLFSCTNKEIEELRNTYVEHITELLGEVMDIAQVCASQLFVFKTEGIDIDSIIKSACFQNLKYKTIDGVDFMYVKPFAVAVKNIDEGVNRIITSVGSIAKLSKFLGKNGEPVSMEEEIANATYVAELFEIINNSYNLLDYLKRAYGVNIRKLFYDHVEKLEKKGYLKKSA